MATLPCLFSQPAEPEEHDVNLDDRGQSNQHPSYLRRQVQFLAFKILSQTHAYINYVCLVPALRYGYNAKYYPVSTEGSDGCFTSLVGGGGGDNERGWTAVE